MPLHRTVGLPCAACAALLLAAAALPPAPALASPLEFIPVGDRLESELRILELFDSRLLERRLRLPHLGTRPLQRVEIEGPGSPPAAPGPARAISLARLERALARDADSAFAPHPTLRSTPRVFQSAAPGGQCFELSLGLEGTALSDGDHREFGSGSGAHARIGVQLDRWLAYTHLIAGRIENGLTFADPLIARNDLIMHTEETYLAYTAASARWSVQMGRNRWHWGPGEEASLVLSKTSAPLTGLAYRLRIEPLHADATALSATLDQAAGEQLAAHRLEWQPRDGLRLGATEAARYHGSAWQPLYAVGVVPYIMVQRLLVSDEPDSLRALRNNILVSFDAAWRVADGTRVYGEFLFDDLHAKSGTIPNKYGWQLGWEGAGAIGSSRVTWGGEFTRLTRFVYTSFFGRTYQAQGRPLGFPTGPDARRIALRAAWDWSADGQLFARVSRTDQGENTLNQPFLPGSPRVTVERFQGVVEQTRDVEGGVRWWPASGVDVAVLGGYRWVENPGHVEGTRRQAARAALELRLVR